MSDICGERFYPSLRPLSGSLHGIVCDRERGHPLPHWRGPKVYCGEIYRRPDGLYYCNLYINHPGLHGREVEPTTLPPPTVLHRMLASLNRLLP